MLKYILNQLINRAARGVTLRPGRPALTLDASMFLLAPLTLWGIQSVYVPVMGTGLSTANAWLAAAAIILLMFVSLFVHSLAHAIFTPGEKHIYLSPLGDPAQAQPIAGKPGKEALTALAGPLAQVLLAVVFYFIWNIQLNTFVTTVTFWLIFYNLGMALLNLMPVFPFDGGRVMRAAAWKLTGRPGTATKLAGYLGWAFAAGLAVWSAYLVSQKARFSLETAGFTILVGILIVVSQLIYSARKWDQPVTPNPSRPAGMVFRTALVTLLMLPPAAAALCLLPMNQGLEAPGFTASVEPMVQVPEAYRNSSEGSLILVTVFPQAPIIAGEWVYAHIDRSIRLTPQENIIPKNETAQSVSLDNYRMLVDSETMATIVGLRLAGFPAEVNNAGVRITSVLETAPSSAVLQPGDIITVIDGTAVITPEDLTYRVTQLTAPGTLQIEVQRGGQVSLLEVPTTEPEGPGGGIKIGITIEQYSTGYELPFPVTITPQKVNGGPSAGLMFTLAVYNLLTPNDITGGKKIAGTGTIDLAGNVGPIGGVQQKVVAAERAGAEYFLCPEANYADAAAMARHIKVIMVRTAQEAVDFLLSLSQHVSQ